MDSFLLAVSVVLPLLIYMMVGMLIRRLGILSEDHLKAMNRMIFKSMIPLALFFSVYRADLKSAVRPGLYLYAWCSVILVFLVLWKFIGKWEKDAPTAATLVQGIYRSNFVLFGGAMADSLCGGEGKAAIAALAAIIVPTFNMLAVILFEVTKGGKVQIGKLILEIFKNPLVDAGILGILVGVTGIRLPELLMGPLETIGSIATPLALVVLGGLLSAKSISDHRNYLLLVSGLRLVVVPLAAVLVGISLGFRGDELVAVLAIFAAPTAVASTPMAQAMGGNGILAGEIVAVTSAGCIVTIFLWVMALSGMGFL